LAEVGGTFTVDEIEYETATNVAADGSRMAVMRENTVSNPVNCSSIGASDEIQVYNEQGDLKWCDNGVETTFGDGYVEIAEIDVTNASSTQWQVTNWAATYQAVKFEFIDFRPTVSGEGIRMRHLSGCATSCFTITSSQNGYQNLVMNEDHSGGASEENTNDNDYFKFASGAQFRTDTVIEVDSASGAGIKGSWTLYSNGSTNPLFGLHHLGYRDASGGLDVAIVGSTSHELTGVSDTTWDGVEFDGTGSANVTGKIRILGLAL
jgi:hypothetical protein